MQSPLPEVLLQIGLYLNAKTSLTWLAVCREWRMAFTPSLWRVVNSREQLWRSILRSVPAEELPSLFSKHKQWIRDLNMDDVVILSAALKANLASLQSLTVGYLGSSLMYRADEKYGLDREPFSPSFSTPNELETLVPKSAFWSYTGNNWSLKRAQAVWVLVLSNSGLHRLRLAPRYVHHYFRFTSVATYRQLELGRRVLPDQYVFEAPYDPTSRNWQPH